MTADDSAFLTQGKMFGGGVQSPLSMLLRRVRFFFPTIMKSVLTWRSVQHNLQCLAVRFYFWGTRGSALLRGGCSITDCGIVKRGWKRNPCQSMSIQPRPSVHRRQTFGNLGTGSRYIMRLSYIAPTSSQTSSVTISELF